ncbi:MAG: tetratricopeptide repeat protein [Elusimicrobiota bacterium]
MEKINNKSLLFLMVFSFGCGPSYDFKRAQKLETKGKYYKAWQAYQEFSGKYPNHKKAPEALFHAGWIGQKELVDCDVAKPFYEAVLQKYPDSVPWARLAHLQRNNCPDYFPLVPGASWSEGDSETAGKNARVDLVIKPISTTPDSFLTLAMIDKTYYGGTSKFKTLSFKYQKTDSELLEFQSDEDVAGKTILMWPLEVGTKWKTKQGKRLFSYEIMNTNQKVSVAAGIFEKCIQVKSSIEGISGFTLESYAPGVGRVLTAVASSGGSEKSVMELIMFQPAPLPSFQFEETK